MDKITVGEFIKQQRIEKNMTLGDFKKLNFDKSLLSKIENDKTFPKADTLQKIAEILDINVIRLYLIAGYLTNKDIENFVGKKL